MTVAQIFGYSIPSACVPHIQVSGVTRAGIEIELENITDTNLNTNYWRSITDGSLRNRGREFVFNGAHGGTDLFLACVELDTFLGRQNPDGNWRCSTHVHVDVRELTATQIKNIVITYLVYEKLLFRLSGFQRYTNNFCAAFGFAQHQLQLLASNWHSDDRAFLENIANGWDKYSALNLRPLAAFGSIEFRSSAAEWRKGKLIRLANRFLAVRDFGAAWEGSHEELIQHLSTLNPRDVMRKGIPPKDLTETWEEDVSVGIKLAHDLLAFANMPAPVREALSAIQGNGPMVNISTPNLEWMIRRGREAHGITINNNSLRGRTSGRRLVSCEFIQAFIDIDGIRDGELLGGDDRQTYREYVFGTVTEQPREQPRIRPVFTEAAFSFAEDNEEPEVGDWV